MKLSPILCFTNSRETAHRLENTTPVETFLQLHQTNKLIFFSPSLVQTFAPGAAFWRSSGRRVLLQTLPWWAEKDAERVWTRQNSTVSRKEKDPAPESDALKHLKKKQKNSPLLSEMKWPVLYLNLILLWFLMNCASWAIVSKELDWLFALKVDLHRCSSQGHRRCWGEERGELWCTTVHQDVHPQVGESLFTAK